MWPALIPILAQYGIPALTYGIGHLIGWFHHKITHTASKPVANQNIKG
jgi:hypothetical protein